MVNDTKAHVALITPVWVLKKLVVHFGLKSFAERTLASWWTVLEKFGREREEALLPGPIKGLAQFLLRTDTKVTPLTSLQMLLVQLWFPSNTNLHSGTQGFAAVGPSK